MKPNDVFSPERILCPIDFSELSSLALKYAAFGAKEFSAELIVFHAQLFEVPRYLTRGIDAVLIDQLQKAKTSVQKEMRDHTEKILDPLSKKLKIKYEVLDIHPVEAILEAAKKESAGLIVMGIHGYSGMKRFLLGSVTENIFRSADIPVFTIRQKEHDFIDIFNQDVTPNLKRILCPCSPTEACIPSLRVAASMADRFQASLTVVQITDTDQTGDSMTSDTQKLRSWISDSITIHSDILPVVRKGNAAEQIIAQARDEKHDIIVIGANHKPFLKETLIGRTTELVMRQSPVPVLMVPNFFTS